MEVHEGEVVVIFGRSGSGKSTVLRCVNFIEDPTEGSIEVSGIRLEGGHRTERKREQIRQLRLRVGMVFQQFNLFPNMTVLDNVMCAPAARREHRRGREAGQGTPRPGGPGRQGGGAPDPAIRWAAAACRHRPRPGDGARRDALRRADVGLDPELTGEVLAVMKALSTELHMTMMVVTHEMGFAREVADRMAFFHEGRILEEGPPEQLINAPRDAETRAFLDAVL